MKRSRTFVAKRSNRSGSNASRAFGGISPGSASVACRVTPPPSGRGIDPFDFAQGRLSIASGRFRPAAPQRRRVNRPYLRLLATGLRREVVSALAGAFVTLRGGPRSAHEGSFFTPG